MVATRDEALMTNPELRDLALLRRYDFAITDANRDVVAAYRSRTYRARWVGVVGALIAGGAGLLGSRDQIGLIDRFLIGYLVGSTLAEAFAPSRTAMGQVHMATLTTRTTSLLLPLWARVLPWVALVPCLFSPLLLLGDHPTGVTHFRDRSGFSSATAVWFSTSAVLAVAGVAAGSLLCWRLALFRLTRRRLPVDSPDAARLDLLTRALSARATSGTAGTLGLFLLTGLSVSASGPLHSTVCTAVSQCHSLYPSHGWYDALSSVAVLAWLSGWAVFWLSRLPRVDAATLRSATESSR